MIELKIGDLLRIKTKKDGEIQLAFVEKVNFPNKSGYNYFASNFWFNDDFTDDFQEHEIIAVWRYDTETQNFLKIYDKVVKESVAKDPYIHDRTNLYTESCKTVALDNDEENPCKPADVPYDKYISLEHENGELKNIIVELNKKLYGKNNKIL